MKTAWWPAMRVGSVAVLAGMFVCAASADGGSPYFRIAVVDEQTGRGVPLVELETVNNIRYWTDSNGLVAFHEPGLMGQSVFFHVRSHGYEFPKDGFGYRGRALQVVEGGSATLKVRRINVAERLYRTTGGGIYRDTVLLSERAPTEQPLLAGKVLGQDSVLNGIYRGKIYWFWGDTNKPSYPLGNFQTSGATSLLPGRGGLDPDVGVNLTYFVDKDGFSRQMTPVPGEGPTWIDGPFIVRDAAGRERMFAHYAKIKPDGTMKTWQRGLLEYNDEQEQFEKVAEYDLDAPVQLRCHPFRHESAGVEYLRTAQPFPVVRVRATAEALRDPSTYEAYTCLKEGSRLDKPELDRAADGSLRWAWKRNTPPVGPKEQGELVKAGHFKAGEGLFHVQDVETGKAVTVHGGSIYWNEYRRRWSMILLEVMGTTVLGEIWYLEADTPLGPWVYARKIVTHDNYSFYNPKQHPFFDKDGGRIIYFEATYTHTFSGSTFQTPRYDYNQIMYKLDLADPRVVLPVPVYDLSADDAPAGATPDEAMPAGVAPTRFATRGGLTAGSRGPAGRRIAFFALDRPRPDAVAVCVGTTDGRGAALRVATSNQQAADRPEGVLFYALPADTKNPPATTTPLYEFAGESGPARAYSTNKDWSRPGWRRSDRPLCLVWRSPLPTCPGE